MANTVDANISVNATMDASDVDKGIQQIITEFNLLSKTVENNINDPLHVTENTINDLKVSLASLSNNTLALDGLIPESQFESAIQLVMDLKDKIDSLSVYNDQILDLGFGSSSETFNNTNNELEELRSNIMADIELFNEFRDVMNEEIDTTGLDSIVEAINTDNTEEMRNAISDILGINDELNESRVETAENTESASQASVDYTGILEELAKKLGLSNQEAATFAKALGATAAEAGAAGAAIAVLIGIIKFMNDRFNESLNALKAFDKGLINVADNIVDAGVSGLADAFVGAIDLTIDGLGNLLEILADVMDEMKDFADAGAEIQRAYYNVYTILGSEAGDEVVSFTEKLETLYGLDSAGLVSDMKSIVAAAGSLGVSTSDMEKATENMTLMANDLSIIAGDFNQASNDIGNAISKGFIGRGSSLYVIMTKQEKDELKSLSSEVERYNYLMNISGRIRERYTDFLQTEAGQLYVLDNRYKALQSNIQMIALSLYAKIAPILTKLIDLANIALTYIMKVFNLDIKGNANKGGTSIADGINKGISDVGKNAKKSGKEVDKLKKQIASFDDVIQINDNKSSGDDDLASGLDKLSDIDLSGIYDLDEALKNTNDEFAEFKKRLNMGWYEGAGDWLANWLADKLEAIPWDEIQKKAKKTADALAQFLNGIVRNKRLWIDIGKTIGESLNTVFISLLAFANRFDFLELGDSLGKAWVQFWETFDEETAAKALYKWFMGVFETAGGFFANMPLTKMAESIVTTMHMFFNNFKNKDKEQMAETVKNILTDVFTSALTLVSGLSTDISGITDFIHNIIKAVENWLILGGGKEAIVRIIQGLFSSIGSLMTGISEIMPDIVLSISELLSSIEEYFTTGGGKEDLTTIIDGIGRTLVTLLEGLANNAPTIINIVKEIIGAVEDWMNSSEGQNAIERIGDAVVSILQTFRESGIIDKVKGIITKFMDAIGLSDILEQAGGIAMDIFGANAEIKIAEILEKIKAFVFGFLQDDELKQELSGFLTDIAEMTFNSLKDDIIGNGGFLISLLDEILDTFGIHIQGLDFLGKVTKVVEDIVQGVKDILNGNGDFSLNSIWDLIYKGVDTMLGGLLSKISSGIQNIKNLFNANSTSSSFKITLPWSGKNAMGGITNGASIGMIGEAGREAILPLENNTGWMDALAEKINGKQGDGSPVVIDISKATKPVYTRAEYLSLAEIFAESMKARGVAVTYNY